VRAEAMVLEALHYDIAVTTPFTLMQHLLEFSESELVEHLYAEFLLEVAGLDYHLSTTCDPLTLAAAVMHLTRHTLLYSQRVVQSMKDRTEGQSTSASPPSTSSATDQHARAGSGERGAQPFLPPGCDWLETALLHYGAERGGTQGQVTAFVERYNATHGPTKANHSSPSPVPYTANPRGVLPNSWSVLPCGTYEVSRHGATTTAPDCAPLSASCSAAGLPRPTAAAAAAVYDSGQLDETSSGEDMLTTESSGRGAASVPRSATQAARCSGRRQASNGMLDESDMNEIWPPVLREITHLSTLDLMPTIRTLHDTQLRVLRQSSAAQQAYRLRGSVNKYSADGKLKVAVLPPLPVNLLHAHLDVMSSPAAKPAKRMRSASATPAPSAKRARASELSTAPPQRPLGVQGP